MLVCVGSCLIQLVSIYGYSRLDDSLPGSVNSGFSRVDPGRVAAQAVSGIGFLGAGAIIKEGTNTLHGLTTAASLWVVMAIGLASGCGYYWSAGACGVLVVFCLIVFKRVTIFKSRLIHVSSVFLCASFAGH